MNEKYIELAKKFNGDIFFDKTHRIIYSTDASAYKEMPEAVALPATVSDIKLLIDFAVKNDLSLIPRGAGTSLAGQVTGKGIVADVSKYMNKIIALDLQNKRVTVQSGVILSDLNKYLEPYNLFFGPETSTANRCTLGGMSGNNACGLHSLIYGSTRDHTYSIKAFLSDGSEAEFKEISKKEFEKKCKTNSLEGKIYSQIKNILSENKTVELIKEEYPHPDIRRRNTGYALDLLIENEIFSNSEKLFNFCKLLSGSEGTLAFISEITLSLVELPPKNKAVVVAHFKSLEDALYANLIALKYKPGAVELTDKKILDLSKQNIEQTKNRFFIEGDPEAILIIEFARENFSEIENIAVEMEKEMRSKGYGYHFPLITGNDIKKVWDLRKAGLGVLSNMPGDAQPVSLVEDTAVSVELLPDYIKEFKELLAKYKLECVFHAHIATGELHLRPILNLKNKDDVQLFRKLAKETALLVKKYKGSLSGEHGDGRLRAEFIPIMYGETIYNIFKEIKKTWDPKKIFNPGKITDTPPMNEHLRYIPGKETKEYTTIFDFTKTGGYQRAAEKCNGSGDCRKSEISGGTLCPSFMASKDEKNSTRARANMLREVLTNSNKPYENKELYKILDLCLSCKACKSECPSGVDVAKLKAEFLQHRYDKKGVPVRTFLIANISSINKILSPAAQIINKIYRTKKLKNILMAVMGFDKRREMPKLSTKTLIKSVKSQTRTSNNKRKVYVFADEFTNYNDTELGIKTIKLLEKLNYDVEIPKHIQSGRTYISKGLIRKAKKIASKNINYLKEIITEDSPLLGIEPSTILTFRDEYVDFFSQNNDKERNLKLDAQNLAKNSLMIDEFLAKEMKCGNISKESFTKNKKKIKLHGHCQQKAVSSTESTKFVLSFPENYEIEEIASGCCGMAGSFGFEKNHYDLSMKIGELVLFPAIRNTSIDIEIAAPGTSCRQQIKEGTSRDAKHPVEILWEALN